MIIHARCFRQLQCRKAFPSKLATHVDASFSVSLHVVTSRCDRVREMLIFALVLSFVTSVVVMRRKSMVTSF